MRDTMVGADALFQQYTIKEIQDVEKKLRNDIERKKEDLRQMVGQRYRDLIDAADTITDMKTSAECVTKHITLIEEHCSRLQEATKPSGILSSSTTRTNKRHEDKAKLFAVAAELKVLMDMPTMLWSAVEATNFLSAAQLFLLAQHIHSSLLLDTTHHFQGVPLVSKFPVIRHQSSLIGQFRSFISEKCRTSLKQDQLTNKELTDILCCILLLDNSSPTELFKEFLDVRLKVVDAILKPYKEGTTVKSQVCEVVQMIVNTVQLVSSVFGTSEEQNRGDSECILFKMLNAFLDRSQEGPVCYLSDKISLSFAYLPAHIKEYRPTIKSKLVPISQSCIQECMKQWIENVKNIVHRNVGELLQYIPSIKGLSLITLAVEKKLSELEDKDWKQDCLSVLKEPISVYEVFFKVAFVERVKVICNKHLENAFRNFQESISSGQGIRMHDSYLEMEDENVTRYVWMESQSDQELWPASKRALPLEGGSTLGMKASRHTPQIQSICKSFDDSLKLLLDDLKCFGDGDTHQRSYEAEVHELQQHLIVSTRAQFTALLLFVRQSLHSCTYDSEPYINIWAPYLGRLCHALAELSGNAKLCLSFDDLKKTNFSSAVKKNHAWQEVKTEILQLSDDSFGCWCSYLAKCFAEKLNQSLGDCSPSSFLQNVLEWEEVEIQEETEDGKSIKSIIRVPIQGSSSLHSALFSLCKETNHTTGHIINRNVTKQFDGEILSCSLDCYREACKKLKEQSSVVNPRLIQTIALQLLFDVRLLSELLSTKDNSKLPEQVDEVTNSLEALIDPFDLDVFNPALQTNLNCALQRSMLLLGLIISERSPSVSSQRLGSQNQPPNLLSLSPRTSKFLLLTMASNKPENLMSLSMKEESPKVKMLLYCIAE